MKFLCDNCKAKYQIADDKVAGKAVRMKCRRCGYEIHLSAHASEEAGMVDGSQVTDRTSFLPGAPVASAEAPSAAAAPRWRPQQDRVEDDESTSIMGAPMRAPAGAGRAPQHSGGPGVSSAGRGSVPPGGGLAPAAVRTPTGVSASRAVAAPRPGSSGSLSGHGTAVGRAPNPSRPAPVPRAQGASPVASAAPRGVGGPDREHGRHGGVGRGPSASAPPPAPSPPPSEEWYVGIGGVPLGPVAVAVIREKALEGLVDPESLVWRDGLDEWKPLKNFPELLDALAPAEVRRPLPAAGVRPAPAGSSPARRSRPEHTLEAAAPVNPASAARRVESPSRVTASASYVEASATPAVPNPVERPSSSGSQLHGGARRATASYPSVAAAPAASELAVESPARVVESSLPKTARSYTGTSPAFASAAERQPNGSIDVLADPFAKAAPRPVEPEAQAALSAHSSSASLPSVEPTAGLPTITKGESALELDEPVRVKRSSGLPAFAYAFIAMAAGFGGVAAWVLLSNGKLPVGLPTAPPQQASVEVSAAPSAAVPTATAEVVVGEPTTEPSTLPVKQAPVLSSGAPRLLPKTPPTGTAAPFDTSGFISTVPGPNPNGPAIPQPGTGTLTQGEIQGIISQNQPLIRRKCWQPALDARSPDAPSTARVTVNVVIGASGNVESATAGGGENFPGLASCIASRVRGWKFPASSSSTPATVPFVFAGQ